MKISPKGSITELDDTYFDYCKTDKQTENLEAYLKHGSIAKTAKALKKARSTVKESLQKIKYNAEDKGYYPSLEMDRGAPVDSGLSLNGASIYRDGIWYKFKRDRKQEDINELFRSFEESVSSYKPLPVIKTSKISFKDIAAVYPMGDPHIGMYAWAQETGQDFNLEIAENNMRRAMQYLIAKTPPAELGIILNLGDFFHSDNQSNRTARAGNALDVDTRWTKVLMIGITIMIDCINMALEKHKRVIVKNNIGNHDDHTSQVLSVALMQAFKDNTRVEIAEPAEPFFAFEFGKTSIFSTHGHMVKPKDMQGVIANYYPELWGNTVHRYCYLGHFHHEQRFEDNGLVTEIFNTLAATDAWHTASGYRAKRNQKAIILDKQTGEAERYTFDLVNALMKTMK